MENLEQLRKELHESVDSKINALTKPKFEVGKVYVTIDTYPFNVTKIEGDKVYGYGFSDFGSWFNECLALHISLIKTPYKECPPELWQQALEKEAVKRGLVEGVRYSPVSQIGDLNGEIGIVGDEYVSGDNFLYNGFQYLMSDGIWATPIKEKTLDEFMKEALDYWTNNVGNLETLITQHCAKHKIELIEILKSLPNE